MDVFFIINCLCAIISIGGGLATVINYNRSKRLTEYSHTSIAFIESQKIISTLTELLKLANSRTSKYGVNYEKRVAANGVLIRTSLIQIREKLSVSDLEEINNVLATESFNVDRYISSLISGDALNEDRIFVIDDNFMACDEAFNTMQKLIKGKMSILASKLK